MREQNVIVGIIHGSEWVSEWVSYCCLTPNEQLFSSILEKQVTFDGMMMVFALYAWVGLFFIVLIETIVRE
jgi:hypothetical protein